LTEEQQRQLPIRLEPRLKPVFNLRCVSALLKACPDTNRALP